MYGCQDFADQHVEAAVARQNDDLTRPVERLHAVRLGDGGSDRCVVERAHDPLRAGLSDPVRRPQRVQAGVEHEDRVLVGEIADGSGDRLRMDLALAARGIGLLVQHLVPLVPLPGDLVEELRIALRLHLIEQKLEGRAYGPDEAECRRSATTEHHRPFVDLDDVSVRGQEIGIGIVRADHQQQVAVVHGVVDGFRADHPQPAHPTRVVEGQDFLSPHRMHQRCLQPVGEGAQ